MRQTFTFSLEEIDPEKILNWCRKFDHFVVLNSNNEQQFQKDPYGKYDLLIAASNTGLIIKEGDPFSKIKDYHLENPDWLFGYFSYDLKNQIENLSSSHNNRIGSDEFYFFQPRYVFTLKDNSWTFHYLKKQEGNRSITEVLKEIRNEINDIPAKKYFEIHPRVSKELYFANFEMIKEHIQRGDIYEMNYCIEFFSENANIDSFSIYKELNSISPMPFSTLLRINNIHVACASPERYLAKRGNKIISQPIKGTARRGNTQEEDFAMIENLSNDSKEKSENVMIVDMVRNDLSRTAERGSVQVEELFGVKTYKQLHQMVSTVTSNMDTKFHFTDVIRNSFPMGSMTGAPKIRAMELIDKYENSRRGIYSGSIGYIDPQEDFDFNVVIRSILYNSENRYLSFLAGSAITIAAEAEKEYDECLLKANAMKIVLSGNK